MCLSPWANHKTQRPLKHKPITYSKREIVLRIRSLLVCHQFFPRIARWDVTINVMTLLMYQLQSLNKSWGKTTQDNHVQVIRDT